MADSHTDERAYRRGVVMGLTMAEIMVLLLFVLLLLFGLRLRKERSEITVRTVLGQAGIPVETIPDNFGILVTNGLKAGQAAATLGLPVTPESIEQIAKDSALGRAVRAGLRQAGIPAETIPDNFRILVANGVKAGQAAATLGLPVTPESVEQIAKDSVLGRAVRAGLGPNRVGVKPEEAARDFVRDASKRYSSDADSAGGPGSSPIWLGGLETRERKSGDGPGGVLPPCARTPAGKAALVLTSELFDDHIVLSDNDIASLHSTAPAAAPLFSQIQRNADLSDSAFLTQTQAVFNWSVTQKCRFYVYVVDRTGDGAKRAYKQRLATVEGHFYKLLSEDGARPQD